MVKCPALCWKFDVSYKKKTEIKQNKNDHFHFQHFGCGSLHILYQLFDPDHLQTSRVETQNTRIWDS